MIEPRVVCILVNWNGWRDTVECLSALRGSDYRQMEIIVVDNASADGSVEQIRSRYPNIEILQSDRNRGFGGGNNLAISVAMDKGAEFVWLLNNDTVPDRSALSRLVRRAAEDKRIGAVASVCYFHDRPNEIQVWAGARVWVWAGYGRNARSPHPDRWFSSLYGASLLVRTSALRQAGVFDERFLHFWEETDLCLRIRRAGWSLAAAPGSRVLHKVGRSTRSSLTADRYFTASGMRIISLHSRFPALSHFLFLSYRLLRRLLTLQVERARAVWRGRQDYLDSLRTPAVERASH